MDAMSDLSALNLEAGSLVGGYTLISRLGSGAMGSVWRVRDDGGHQYAMKILRDSLAEEDASGERSRDQLTARERLRREAMALQKVRHPGVCGIVDMELDDALAFIVTELIDGKNLREDVRVNGRYVGDDLERLGRKLIEAVKAVHAAGIVHRDIKPTNVMVSNTGPVLVDFGIAMGEGESHVTRTGLVMGTPGFIAPEIIDGAESDEMSDWWSVASVLAFAATGEPVFGTKPMMAVLERAAAGSANLVGLPAGTMAAFRSALNPDRTKRCTPDELLQAIALDALNPQAWDAADTASDSGSTAGISEAMPPFAESPDNPRELWRALDHITGEDAIGTRTLPQFVEATQTIGTTGIADITDTVIADASDAGTSVMNINAHTTTIPLGTGTRVMPVQDAWNPTQEATQIDPAIKPALQRIANQRPPAVIPNASVEKAQNVHAQDIPTSTMPVMPATPITQASPAAPLNLNAPQPPNPADVLRGELLSRGTLLCALLAIPVALFGLFSPWLAWAAGALLAWLLATIGFNMEAQLEREGRRGGNRKASDWFARAATLPWHVLKGLGYAVPRALIMAAIATLGLAIATVALQLPFAMVDTSIFGFTIPLPTWIEGPVSQSGVVQAGCCAIGWLICALTPGALALRLGAGTLRGRPKSSTPAESYEM
ncbi:serine/threonine protein kinase [Bifidobacterium catenulatum subsp. kashiwanohense]|uniref:non-specific serine/threonine protein kinase n=1 Tax=Bifidobacterium catenulatum subsp. kashiwanohense TaxID=630129 RepID=A0AAJ1P8C2_9BIFI|nr:serine/threonine-protein kinase [Bifidobacterium catenulatum]MDH7881697.1 serine/threonine protein kinase [Bifidobacterium catenulatum subsp. kashiwanohense]MDH7885149.1 serine/threonine protein kinase [Bifidobacterium catenulatum subsp. kashiwanohense]MDH7887046.1 serine/threonine protein kinase [Bifidobacterium catenulatum subsp. kashiwanohense]MDH7898626.1 serine/threonine protein kinase [Bifidobacterium catenulatum subsp. kashiwanohense]MDH7900736.1 serine/threonine protein kinase [Bifi